MDVLYYLKLKTNLSSLFFLQIFVLDGVQMS